MENMDGENSESFPKTQDEKDIEEKANNSKTLPQRDSSKASNVFNPEEFLARVNMNETLSNILRSPTKTPGGIRQRSIFTAAIAPSPSSRFNASIEPFVPQNQSSPLSSTADRCCDMTTPIEIFNTTGALTSRQAVSPYYYGGVESYESPLTSRSGGITRGPVADIYNAHYPVAQSQPSQIYGFDRDIYRGPTNISPSHHRNQQLPQPMPPPPFILRTLAGSQRGGVELLNNNVPSPSCSGTGSIVMPNGTIQLRLRDGVRIDMTLDKAVRVLNQHSMVAIALSRNCSSSALIHPNGRVLQCGTKVEIVTYDGMKSNNYVRYAKMWYKGISFTSESCALIYLVDTAGTRTTTDTFTDLTKDYTLTVFYDNSRYGPCYVQEANDVVQNSTYMCTEEGTEIYEINGFRITQAADGLVRLTRIHNKCLIRTSPSNGSATLTTLGIHCTASMGKTSHLFVRRNEKRMHFDGSSFIVRNAGHSAGFNENNLLIVY